MKAILEKCLSSPRAKSDQVRSRDTVSKNLSHGENSICGLRVKCDLNEYSGDLNNGLYVREVAHLHVVVAV